MVPLETRTKASPKYSYNQEGRLVAIHPSFLDIEIAVILPHKVK